MREIILEKLFCLAILSEFVSDLRPQLVSSIPDQELSLPVAQDIPHPIVKSTKRKSKFNCVMSYDY